MITKDKITEIFCIADDFCKEFELETDKIGLSERNKGCHRHRRWRMSKSEIITILIYCCPIKPLYAAISSLNPAEIGMISSNFKFQAPLE